MNRLLIFLCLAASVLSMHADTAEAVLGRMDKAAPNFKAMSSDVQMTNHIAVLNDNTVEKGTFEMQKKGKEVRAIMNLSENGGRILGFFGKIVRIYYPNLNTYQDYQVGKQSNLLNQFLLLGFGSSGKELVKSYSIATEGTEMVNGKPTTKLMLIPKDKAVLEHLTKVEVWIPDNGANPVQQQFYESSGNSRQVTYSNIHLNPPIKGTLEMKLPSGATRQKQ